jgi:hypothetical protein
MTTDRKRLGAAMPIALLVMVTAAGCGGFDRLDFQYKSAPPDGATVSFDQIRIHEGIAVGVKALPYEGKDLMDEDTLVELDTANPGVLGVGRGIQDVDWDGDDERSNWNFVIFGAGAGSTEVTVRIDGDLEARIQAVVESQ